MEVSLVNILGLIDASVSRAEKRSNPKLQELMHKMRELVPCVDIRPLKKLGTKERENG